MTNAPRVSHNFTVREVSNQLFFGPTRACHAFIDPPAVPLAPRPRHPTSMFTSSATNRCSRLRLHQAGYVWVASEGRPSAHRNFGFKDRFAQGGMNEEGSPSTPRRSELPWTVGPPRKNTDNLLEHIMNTCATVAEAEPCFAPITASIFPGASSCLPTPPGIHGRELAAGTGLGMPAARGFPVITNTRIAASGYRCERYVLAGGAPGRRGDAIGLAAKALDASTARPRRVHGLIP